GGGLLHGEALHLGRRARCRAGALSLPAGLALLAQHDLRYDRRALAVVLVGRVAGGFVVAGGRAGAGGLGGVLGRGVVLAGLGGRVAGGFVVAGGRAGAGGLGGVLGPLLVGALLVGALGGLDGGFDSRSRDGGRAVRVDLVPGLRGGRAVRVDLVPGLRGGRG